MDLRQQRAETSRAIAEKRFVRHVLSQEGKEIDRDIQNRMSGAGFRSDFWNDRLFTVVGDGNRLEYRHRKQHRFVDMRTRDTKDGKIRKKSHPIHNRIIYGHLNNIVRELSHGFTDDVIAHFQSIEESD